MVKLRFKKKFYAGFFILSISFLSAISGAKQDSEMTSEAVSSNSNETYTQGALVGSVLGFGIGHGMQDRYSADKGKGWLFTIGEAAPFAIVIGGSILEWIADSCSGDAGSHADCRSSRSRIFSTTDAWNSAIAVFIGFKIWEIIDLWSYPRTSSIGDRDTAKFNFQIVAVPINQKNLSLGIHLEF